MAKDREGWQIWLKASRINKGVLVLLVMYTHVADLLTPSEEDAGGIWFVLRTFERLFDLTF